MKTIATSLIVSFALIGAAQAAGPVGSSIDTLPFQGVYGQADNSTSRAQVQAELQKARNEGLVANSDVDNAPFTAQADSGVSRDEVAAQAAPQSGTAISDLDNVPFQG
ncbi:DUF4148 domain-containing protein [Achromobacter aloeverae]